MVGLGRLRDGWLCPGTVAHSFLYTSYYDILRTQTAAPSLRLAGPYTIQYASAVKMVGLSSSGGFRSPETRSFQLPARVPTQWCWTQRCDMQTTGWDRQPTGCDVHTTATVRSSAGYRFLQQCHCNGICKPPGDSRLHTDVPRRGAWVWCQEYPAMKLVKS